MNLRVIAVAAACLSLGACASVLKDLQTCERHYNGTVSGGAIQPAVMAGAALIDCCPVNYVVTPDHKGCTPNAFAVGALVPNGPPPTTKP